MRQFIIGTALYVVTMLLAVSSLMRERVRTDQLTIERDFAHATAVEAKDRARRLCADVALRGELADAWALTRDHGKLGRTIQATLEGARTICAEIEDP